MNITEYGKLMGVGKTTIYRRISQAGLDLSDLRGEDGQLTDAGLSTLSALLDGTPGTSVGHSNSHQEDVPPGRSTSGTVEDLKTQLETTRAELAAAQARINELLQQAADRERDHAEAWRKYAEVQQQILQGGIPVETVAERRVHGLHEKAEADVDEGGVHAFFGCRMNFGNSGCFCVQMERMLQW